MTAPRDTAEEKCVWCGLYHSLFGPCGYVRAQEGAPSGDPGESGRLKPAGAPSCDSPELAAIRKRALGHAEGNGDFGADDRHVLLRMVDELTADKAEMQTKLTEAFNEHVCEVHELRAKLAEAEMREKLHHGADLTRALQRAEAAEARVRTLTDALFAATGGHVDLDRL